MTRTVRRRPEVYYDVIEAAEYIERDSAEAALRFFDAVDSTLQGLAEMPGKGAVREFDSPKLQGVRAWPIDGFPNYLIFYRLSEPNVAVIAIRTEREICLPFWNPAGSTKCRRGGANPAHIYGELRRKYSALRPVLRGGEGKGEGGASWRRTPLVQANGPLTLTLSPGVPGTRGPERRLAFFS